MNVPRPIAVLGSTRGTDMQAIIDAIAGGSLAAEITVVISDRKRAGILERARDHKIEAVHIPARSGGVRKEREEYDREVDAVLQRHKPEIILLIGYMRIVSPWFCSQWADRLVNVHPSLLPDFAGGMDGDVHSAVIAAGRKETGCTVHLVTEEVDGGPILLQKRCPVLPEDTPDTLKARVQQLEGEALIEVIKEYEPHSGFTW